MISILTPSLQYGHFLEEAIWSVAAQEGPCEHVVQDALSTDSTVDVLARHPNVSSVREADGGQSDALRRALKRSSGEWIGWLNADEFYLPGALAAARPAMMTGGADVVFGDAVLVDEHGLFLRSLPTHTPRGLSLSYYGPVLASCATFVRRDLLEAHLWDQDLRWTMDWKLWLDLQRAGARFRHLPRALAAYRVHPGQVTRAEARVPAGELRHLRQHHGLIGAGPLLRLAVLAGHIDHGLRKLGTGGYARQFAGGRSLGGHTLGWTVDGPRGPAPSFQEPLGR